MQTTKSVFILYNEDNELLEISTDYEPIREAIKAAKAANIQFTVTVNSVVICRPQRSS